MSWLSSSTELVSNGWLSSQYPGLGILGSAIPTTGDNGGSPATNDNLSPSREYFWRLVTPPNSGVLTLNEDLSYSFVGAADGVRTWEYGLYEDGLPQGTAIVSDSFGAITATVFADGQAGYAIRQFVQADIRCDYLIRSNILADSQALYDILNGVSVSSANTATYALLNSLVVSAINTASYIVDSNVVAGQAKTFIKHNGKYIQL